MAVRVLPHKFKVVAFSVVPVVLFLLYTVTPPCAYGGQSMIVDTHVVVCGESRDQAIRETAEKSARESAAKAVAALQLPEAVRQKLSDAYRSANVRFLENLGATPSGRDGCLMHSRRIEVIPGKTGLEALSKEEVSLLESDPQAPLAVKIWTERLAYREGEKIRISLKGNKSFYARVVYKDAGGNLVQLLPNPYRQEHFIAGGEMSELPSASDRFDMEVTTPFGTESIIVYAATAPVGELQVTPADTVYQVQTAADKVPITTRGVRPKNQAVKENFVTEFCESMTVVVTSKGE